MPSTTRAAAPLPLLGADAPPVRVGLPATAPNPTELLVEAARSAITTQVGIEVDERLGADQWILFRACETRRECRANARVFTTEQNPAHHDDVT
jgi:hypothetical protein